MFKDKLNAPACLRLIETDDFPIDFLSSIAEHESWRKEVFRPIYHAHKWWANRLGSIFRGIILGSVLPEGTDLQREFYQKQALNSITIFDPFMGSGTTVGEAYKLGCVSFGQDINPVACESVRIGLGPLDKQKLAQAFEQLELQVGTRIRSLYKSVDQQENSCDVLYYFWVMDAKCPMCKQQVDLFSSYIFARNAYPKRKPEVQVYCPDCGNIFQSLHEDASVTCPHCQYAFNPHKGPVQGAHAICSHCHERFAIAEVIKQSRARPLSRMYAKLILREDGAKAYLPTTSEDILKYQKCETLLHEEVSKGAIRLPETMLIHGYNTKQAMNYNFLHWRDFFNSRQLLALGWLQTSITTLPDVQSRDALFLLFSGILEFNNMFASYKGEGTGAVRHMFSHHILKPERTPIEANVWGTPKSSGSFSNLFKSRLMRVAEYQEAPYEISVADKKRILCNSPMKANVQLNLPANISEGASTIYLSCGNSESTSLHSDSIDLVITDPPFFDNVHYSELADFFFAWERLYPHGFIGENVSTRHEREVQDGDAIRFAEKLQVVFKESYRILKNTGLLVFTYHHSHSSGWESLAQAIWGAGFSVVNAHPVKAEMLGATPKSQAKEPIQLDIILVCKKRTVDIRPLLPIKELEAEVFQRAARKVRQLLSVGMKLSRNDYRIIFTSLWMVALGPIDDASKIQGIMRTYQMNWDKQAAFVKQLAQYNAITEKGEFQQSVLFGIEQAFAL